MYQTGKPIKETLDNIYRRDLWCFPRFSANSSGGQIRYIGCSTASCKATRSARSSIGASIQRTARSSISLVSFSNIMRRSSVTVLR